MHNRFLIVAPDRSAMVWCNYHTGRPHPVLDLLSHALAQMEGQPFPQPDE